MKRLQEQLKELVDQHFRNPQTRFNAALRVSFLDKFLYHPDLPQTLLGLMKGKTLTFVRHAESQLNLWQQSPENFVSDYPKNPSLYDPSITVVGFRQCEDFPSGTYDIAYVSPSLRTLQTYENLPIACKREVVTPLIRQRNRIRAAVVGTATQLLRLNFPALKFPHLEHQQYWWRHDYAKHPQKGLRRQDDDSLQSRMAFFLIWVLLQPDSKILIVSHSVFYDKLLDLQYFERPDNCRPYPIEPNSIVNFFQRLKKTPKASL